MKQSWMRWLAPAAATVALFVAFHGSAALAEGQTVSGTVTGTDGKPAASVKVRLFKAADMPAGGRRPGADAPTPGADAPKPEPKAADPAKPGDAGNGGAPAAGERKRPTPVGEATTDDKGAFSIKDVVAGDYVVAAGDRTSGMAREKVTVAAGSDPAAVALTLKQGRQRGGPGGAAPGAEKPKPTSTDAK